MIAMGVEAAQRLAYAYNDKKNTTSAFGSSSLGIY